jgi:hypothetical protein
MTMDEFGDDFAPQVATRFDVTDCSLPQPIQLDISSVAAAENSTSLWSILQRDETFGAGWPSSFFVQLPAQSQPLFSVSPPPIETRMHFVMEGIFAAVVVAEYAQLMGVNLKLPAENTDAASGSVRAARADDYKYIPVVNSYHVDVLSSFAPPPLSASVCSAPSACSHTTAFSATAEQTCNPNARHDSTAVVTLITSDSYLQGALVLL